MSQRRILIVDDDKDILFLLALSIKKLNGDFEVITATDGPGALEQVQKGNIDLVITDYMMPGMSGIQLVEEVRRISPETQVVLMTAYDTAQVRRQVKRMDLSGFVGKPFTVPEVLDVVKRVMVQTPSEPVEKIDRPDWERAVSEQLQTLRAKSGAHYVVLMRADGAVLYVDGQVNRARAGRLAAFVAANFLAVAELAHLLDDNESVFHSTFHEGSRYSIYACGVGGEYLLAVVFGTAGKPGTVWFYAKQAAAAMAALLGQPDRELPTEADEGDLAADFDQLLGDTEEGL